MRQEIDELGMQSGRRGDETLRVAVPRAPIGIGDEAARLIDGLAASAQLRTRIGAAARATLEPRLSWDEVLKALEAPLARMAAASSAARDVLPFRSSDNASALHKAVCAIDGLLYAGASLSKGLIDTGVARKMIGACLEKSSAADVLRGIMLAARLRYRPVGRALVAGEAK